MIAITGEKSTGISRANANLLSKCLIGARTGSVIVTRNEVNLFPPLSGIHDISDLATMSIDSKLVSK